MKITHYLGFIALLASLIFTTSCKKNGQHGNKISGALYMQTNGIRNEIICYARMEDGDLVITPDPFHGARVPLEVSVRELPHRPFASATEALEAFRATRATSLTGGARGDAYLVCSR